jgi:hypothetical protein
LRSFTSHGHIKDVDPTTTRLVERCLEEPRRMERSHRYILFCDLKIKADVQC